MTEDLGLVEGHERVAVSSRRGTERVMAGDQQVGQLRTWEEVDGPELEAEASWRLGSGRERDPGLWGSDAGRGVSSAQ
jgi:hypothetical protein